MSVQSRYAIRMVAGVALAAVLAVAGGWSGLVQAQAPVRGVKFSQVTPQS